MKKISYYLVKATIEDSVSAYHVLSFSKKSRKHFVFTSQSVWWLFDKLLLWILNLL